MGRAVSQIPADGWLSAEDPRVDGVDRLEFRDAFIPFDAACLDQPIFNRFREMALRHGPKIAVVDGALSLTYDQLYRSALDLAHRLNQCGPSTRPVALVLSQGAFFPVAALACLAAGRPFAPIDRSYPRLRNRKAMRELAAAAVIVGHAADAHDADAGLPCIDIASSLTAAADQQPYPSDPDAPSLILFTSGTTGDPKGICNSQRALLQRVFHATNSCRISSEDRLALFSSFCTIAGVRECFSALLNGATLHVMDPTRLGISGLLKLMRESRITIGYLVPVLLRSLLSAPSAREAFSTFRILRTGGDNPLKSDLDGIRSVAPRTSILIAFSSTEMPTAFQWFVPDGWQPERSRLPIGYLQPGFECRLDIPADDLSVEMAGELIVRSRYLALGYWQGGRLTEGPFVRCDQDPSMRILHTGDVVRVRSDALVEMLGRKDRQVKLRGYRVNLNEVEAVLRDSPRIADAAVIARKAGEDVSALVAFVVPSAPADKADAPELKEEIEKHLPSYMRPIQFRVLHEIPKLAGMKPDLQKLSDIDRQELADERRRTSAAPAVVATNVESHRAVRDVVERAWRIALDRSSIEPEQPWDDAGGDSLATLNLWFGIEQALGPLPLDMFRPQMSPSALVQAIAGRLQRSAVVRDVESSPTPLVFFMPPYDGDLPLLVRFRAALEDRIRFSVVHYPGWKEMMKSEGRFEPIVDAVLRQILPQIDGRACALAGYSFGGIVAAEIARRLMHRGHDVAFVGLIDTALDGLLHPRIAMSARAGRFMRQARSSPGMEALIDPITKALLRRSKLPTLNVMEKTIALMSTKLALTFQRHLTGQMRLQAIHKWKVAPLDVSATLFRSDDHREWSPDFGWRRVCDALTIVPIGGTHESILQPPHLNMLCDRFAESVERALPHEGQSLARNGAAAVARADV
ncbi:MAG: AMP-binding protein [Xanthobacteraceae bacterium]|nr:AMP-binding protein [Xanthobacteraceae bacterium]